MMTSYIETLIKMQWDLKPEAEKYLRAVTLDSDAKLPEFEVRNFSSKDELFDWISSDTYTYPEGNTGVCYGF